MLIALSATALPTLRIVAAPGNDLWRAVDHRRARRYATVDAALRAARPSDPILLLAGPDGRPAIPPSGPEHAGRRIFVEFPQGGPERDVVWERAVVVRPDAVGLPPATLLATHRRPFVALNDVQPWLVLARVAGYHQAVFGLDGTEQFPLLGERGDVLLSACRISDAATSRLAPAAAWQTVWNRILAWLTFGAPPKLDWHPALAPAFGRSERMPAEAERLAVKQGADWFLRSGLILGAGQDGRYRSVDWPDRVGPRPERTHGDGSFGILEGFSSAIGPTGEQSVRWWRRADCTAESAGALAIAGHEAVARNLMGFLWDRSPLSQGNRNKPDHPAYGLLGWNDVPRYSGDLDGFGVYYGDDNARALLGSLLARSALDEGRWDARIARCLVANLGTTGKRGFRRDRIDEPELMRIGLEALRAEDHRSYAPHFQAYLWACFLWAFAESGDERFLASARAGITETMQAGEAEWRWTNGLQQERARMLLPLAWLCRVDDQPEHRRWLREVAQGLVAKQTPEGAVLEELGSPSAGMFRAAATNAEYGVNEAPLIQANGDPATDALYTINFLFLGLHEAAAVLDDPALHDAEDRLAAYFVRIQARSKLRPELDGAWFRAFDVDRWEFWGSNGDAGWGAWAVETGWTQSWIVAVLALRHASSSLWEAAGRRPMRAALALALDQMLPKADGP